MTKKKKVGFFFLGLSAFPAAILVQNLVMVPILGVRVLHFFSSGEAAAILQDIRVDTFDQMGDLIVNLIFDLTIDASFLEAVELFYAVSIILLFGLWFYKIFHKESLSYRSKKKRIPVLILGLLLLAVGGQYLSELIYEIAAGVMPWAAENYEELMELVGMDNPSIMSLVYGIVIGPIAEELIFRGVMMRYLNRAVPFVLANIVQAALFGIYHMNVMQSIYTGLIGLLFGYIAYRAGNLWFSIIAHMIFNIFGFSNLLFLGADNPYFNFLWMPVMILALILGSMLYFGNLERRGIGTAREDYAG